jgi:tetratricopeptide (TPR) repeat protein
MIKFITKPFKNISATIAQSSNVVSYSIIGILVVLGPLFFFPVRAMSVVASKGYFVALVTIIAVLVAGITVLKRGSITVSKNILFLAAGAISLITLLGAVLSPSFSMAFWGYGFETTTWFFVATIVLMMVFAYKTIKTYDRIGVVYGGLFISFLCVAVLQIIRFIAGPATANLGVLGGATSTLVGSWSDLGIFTGLVLLMSIITLQLAGLTRFAKWFVATVAVVAGVFLLVMNMNTVWIVLGFMSLLLVLYLFAFAYWDTSAKAYKKEKRVPWYILALFGVSLIGIFFGGLINGYAGKHQNITWNDVRPSFATTVRVAQKNLVHNFATGYGPNSFGLGWSLAKPPAVAGSVLAGSDFTVGYSYVTSLIATSGLLGALLWIVFFGILGYSILKRLAQGFENSLDRYFVISLAGIISFLSVIAWVAVPGTYLLVLWVLSVGAFIALFLPQQEMTFSFVKDPRASFFGILGVTVVIIATFLGGYSMVRKLASFVHDTRGVVAMARGDLATAAGEINLATMYASHDAYHIQLAQLALGDASKLLTGLTESNKQVVSKQAEQVLGIALGHAKAATTQNPLSYKNWVMLGNVYRSAVTLGVSDAVALAKDAYAEAQKRNPSDAALYLNNANLALANKDTAAAYKSIQDSIDLFPTRDAYLLRAQVQIGQQKWSELKNCQNTA